MRFREMVVLMCVLSSFFSESRVSALEPGYAPMSVAWVREHRFPMRMIGRFSVEKAPSRLPIGNGGVQLSSANRDGAGMAVTLHGTAKDGTKWEAMISGGCCTDAFDVHTADLDNNGQQDAIITFRVATTGLEAEFEHLMLLFDSNGLPTPYITVGCCLDEADKMLDFVDLDNDGQAEVFDQSMSNEEWLFAVYRADNTRWQRVSRWPCVPSVPMVLQNRLCGTIRYPRSLDTTQPVVSGRMRSFSDDPHRPSIVLGKSRGATETVRLRFGTDLHCVLVVDTPSRRRILFGNAHGDEWKRTLTELASGSPNFYGLGELGIPPWLDEPNRTAPMIAWFSYGFSSGDRHHRRRH